MAYRINSGLAPRWYTPEDQKKEARPARFQLKPLTGLFKTAGLSGCFRGTHFELTEAQASDILQRTLMNWDGIEDANGNPLPCSPENYELLPGEVIQDLINEALVSSTLLEDERKNSPSQSPCTETPAPSIAGTADGGATATAATPPPIQSGASPASSSPTPA